MWPVFSRQSRSHPADSGGSELFNGVQVMLSLIKDSTLGLVTHFIPGAVQHSHAMVALESFFVLCHEMPVQGVQGARAL